MKKYIVLILLATISVSCNQKFRDDFFSPTITKIEIKQHLDGKTYVAEKQLLEEYKNLIKNSEETDYCCCPTENFTISLFAIKDNYNTFHVDTVEFKNKVRIFQTSYQYSYLIKKENWKAFLNKVVSKTNHS